jgi:rare lipoprotein A
MSNIRINWKCLFFMLFGLFLYGCSSKKTSVNDSAPVSPPHPHVLDKIPDAVPVAEPLSRYGNRFGKNAKSNSYVALKRRYTVMSTSKGYHAKGLASWYGTKFQGRRTSSGEPYNMYKMTAAHPTLPLPTFAKVTNLDNGKSVIVKINDRGPFHSKRLIDLSYVAAHKLGILGRGTGNVEVKSVDPRDHGRNYQVDSQKPVKSNRAFRAPFTQQAPTLTTKEPLYLQLGAFSQKANAEELLQKIGKISKLPANISQSKNNKSTVFKVWMGPFKDQQEARKLSQKLAQAQLPPPVVITKHP